MEADALVKAAGNDPSDEGDIIFHLCEKIREQSQVVADLQKRVAQSEAEGTSSKDQQMAQKCKDLERKLADLTRPIALSDTLSFPPPSVSLSLSQLMELYSLLYVRMNEVLKEKEELQANLHEEILFSEEQSVILETMREEMASAPRGHFRSESAQTLEVSQVEECRKDSEDEIKAKSEALAEAYAEIAKLEEEKNALLEYVEQQALREDKAADELHTLREELKSLREENDHLQLPQSPVAVGSGIQQAQEDLASLRSAYEKTMLEMEELEEHNQSLQQALAQANCLTSEKEAEAMAAAEDLDKARKEMEALKLKQEETLHFLEELQDFRKSEEEANSAVLQEEHVAKLEEDNKSLRRLLSQLQNEIETLHTTKPVSNQICEDKAIATDQDEALASALLCQRQVESLRLNMSQLISQLNPTFPS